MEGEQPGAALPPDVAAIAELLLERLDAATGNWRVELFATDGRLRKFARQEEGGRDTLTRFNKGGTDV
jgi:hypothetical protein